MKNTLITETNKGGKKVQKAYNNINPNATDAALEAFAQMTSALSNNGYEGAYVVTKRNVDGSEPYIPGGASYVTVPVEVTVPGETVTIAAETVTVTVEAEPVTVTVEGDPKTAPTFSLGQWSNSDTVYSAVISYNGDGNLSVNNGSINNGTLTIQDEDGNFNGVVTASEGNVYAPGLLAFDYKTTTIAGASSTVTVEAEPVTVTVEAEPVTVTVGGGGLSMPSLSLGGWSAVDTVFTAPVIYSGDGNLSANVGSISNNILTVNDVDGIFSGVITASEGNNFAATNLAFDFCKKRFTPNLSLGEWIFNGGNYSAGINYDGDGTLSTSTGTISGSALTADPSASGIVTASSTEMYYSATATFTVPAETDPNAQYLAANMNFDISSTLDACNNVWTAVGDASLSSDIKKSGNSSLHCPAGAYLIAQTPLDVNSTIWTIDFWIRFAQLDSQANGLFACGTVDTTGSQRYGVTLRRTWLAIAANDDSWQYNQKPDWAQLENTNVWTHVAIVKNGSTVTLYENGQAELTRTLTQNIRTGNYIWLGGTPYGAGDDLYIDNFRIYDGVALWTENFTPPTYDD